MSEDIELMREYARRYEYLRNRISRKPGKLWVAMGDWPGGISHWNGIDLDHQIDREMQAQTYNDIVNQRVLMNHTSNNQSLHDVQIDSNPLSRTYGQNVSPYK